jgi:hypothetical protein
MNAVTAGDRPAFIEALNGIMEDLTADNAVAWGVSPEMFEAYSATLANDTVSTELSLPRRTRRIR